MYSLGCISCRQLSMQAALKNENRKNSYTADVAEFDLVMQVFDLLCQYICDLPCVNDFVEWIFWVLMFSYWLFLLNLACIRQQKLDLMIQNLA